jgi:DNA-binding protein H-NS
MVALEEHAKALGFSLAELTGVKVRKARAGVGRVKYQHPVNPAITWSVQGRKPRWFTDAIEAGSAPESMSM